MALDEITQDVSEHGWSAISIDDVDPPFMYTVGLLESFDHPEVIVFGLDATILHGILATVVSNLRDGARYSESGTFDGVLDAFPIAIRKVHETQHTQYLGCAMAYCLQAGRMDAVEAVQLFWPDKSGVFPFQPNCDMSVHTRQPRLDIPLMPSEVEELERDW